MHNAVEQLALSGFDRADLSLPDVVPPADRATPEAGAKPADTEEDARQARTLHTQRGCRRGGVGRSRGGYRDWRRCGARGRRRCQLVAASPVVPHSQSAARPMTANRLIARSGPLGAHWSCPRAR